MNKWLPWVASATLIAVGGAAVYLSTIGLDDTQAATLDYITASAEQGDVTVTSAATGSVAAADTYALAFGVDPTLGNTVENTGTSTWTVDEVLVTVGEHVSAGQVLATADTSDLETSVSQTEASLERARLLLTEAQSDLDDAPAETAAAISSRKTTLEVLELQLSAAQDARDEATSGSEQKTQGKITILNTKDSIETTEVEIAQLKAERTAGYPDLVIAVGEAEQSVIDLEQEIETLQEELRLATVIAPVDGVVSQLNVTAGFTASDGAAAVIESDTLEVVASVVESDIGSLVVGQEATVSIDAVDQDVVGVVTSVVPTTTGSTSSVVSYPVTVTLSDPDGSVLSGMTTDVEIVLESANDVISVPVTALEGRADDYLVQVVNDDGSSEMRSVTVGLVTETRAEIQSGLAVGEEVVIGSAADRTASEDDDESAFDINALSGGGGGPEGGPPAGGRGQ